MDGPERTLYGVHPRTAIRVIVSTTTFLFVLGWFHEPLFTLLDGLSSSDGLSGRRLTLLLLAALSVFPPLLLATVLADALYDRWVAGADRRS